MPLLPPYEGVVLNSTLNDWPVEIIKTNNASMQVIIGDCEGQNVLTGNHNFMKFQGNQDNQLHSPSTIDQYHSKYQFSGPKGYFFLKSHSVKKGQFRLFLRQARQYPPISSANLTILLRKLSHAMSVQFIPAICPLCIHQIILASTNSSLQKYLACKIKDENTKIYVLPKHNSNRLLEEQESEITTIDDDDIPDSFAVTVMVSNPHDGSVLIYQPRYVHDYDQIEAEYFFMQQIYLLAIIFVVMMVLITTLRICRAKQMLCFRTRNVLEFEMTEEVAAPAEHLVEMVPVERGEQTREPVMEGGRQYEQFVDEQRI